MLRALLWKEWRQLRALRWVGLGLALVVSVVALTAPAAARQGWIPLANFTTVYSAADILLEALPRAFVFILWPLVALLMSVQSFSGDRSVGTESFLLERPVPRRRFWGARLLASTGSTLAVVAGSLLIWALLVAALASPEAGWWSGPAWRFGMVGLMTTLSCLLAGMMAASLLNAPLAALLLGVVLVAAPAGLAITLGGYFWQAKVGEVPVGAVVSALFVLAYPVGSFLALCRGEPAGRGRILRGVVSLVAGLVLVFLLFVVSAATTMRVLARQLPNGATVVGSPVGGTAFAESFGGWLIDLESGKRTRFLPPPIQRGEWNRDGSRLAVLTHSGVLGSYRAESRVEFYDASGRPAGRVLELGEVGWTRNLHWAGDRLVLILPGWEGKDRILVYSPDTGEWKQTEFTLNGWRWSVVGPTLDGRLFLAYDRDKPEDQEESDEDLNVVSYGLYRIDIDRGVLESDPLVEDVGRGFLAHRRLSPSGRYWIRDDRSRDSDLRPVLDLDTGEETGLKVSRSDSRWMAEDTLVWPETDGEGKHLRKARPGEAPVTLRSWPRDRNVGLWVSPDGRRLLITVRDVLEQKDDALLDPPLIIRQRVLESWVYELEEDRWIELPAWPPGPHTPWGGPRTVWAGPRTLARTDTGFLALVKLDDPDGLLPVVGSKD